MAVATGVALAGTVYCWIRNQSAGTITAGEEQTGLMIIPDFSTDFRSYYAGISLRF